MTKRITRRRRNMRGGRWGMKKTAKAHYDQLPDWMKKDRKVISEAKRVGAKMIPPDQGVTTYIKQNLIPDDRGYTTAIKKNLIPDDRGITTGIKKGFTDMTTHVGEKYREREDKQSKYRVEQLPTKPIFPGFSHAKIKPVAPILEIDDAINNFLAKSYDEETEYKTEYDEMIQYINSLSLQNVIEDDLELSTEYIKEINKYISDLDSYTSYIESEIKKSTNKIAPTLFDISDYKQKIKEIQFIKEPVEDYYSKTKPLLIDVNTFIDKRIGQIDDKIKDIIETKKVKLIQANRIGELELFKNSLETTSSNLKILKKNTENYIIYISEYFWMAHIVELLKVQYASISKGESPKFQIDKDILPKAFKKANEAVVQEAASCAVKIQEKQDKIDELTAENAKLQTNIDDLMKDPNQVHKIQYGKTLNDTLQKWEDEKARIEKNTALTLDKNGFTAEYTTAKRNADTLENALKLGTIFKKDEEQTKISELNYRKTMFVEALKSKIIKYALAFCDFEITVTNKIIDGNDLTKEFLTNYHLYKNEWVQLLDSVIKVFEAALSYYSHIDDEEAESRIKLWIDYFTAKKIWFKDYVDKPEYASYYSNYKENRLLVFPPNYRANYSGTYVPARFKGLFQTLVYQRPNGGPEQELIKKMVTDVSGLIKYDYNNIFTTGNVGKGSKKKRKPNKRYKTRRRR